MEAGIRTTMASHSASTSTSTNPNNGTLEQLHISILRQWRPKAQNSVRNQWSKLSRLRHDWIPFSSSNRSHATFLINTYLTSWYLDDMDLGVLSDMPDIRKKAHLKLLKKQHGPQLNQLLSSYKSMVGVVVDMVNSCRSMRCYVKASSGSPLIEFSNSAANSNDNGDGGGVQVFTFLPISAFEMLAEELVEMFRQELLLKRFLVVELLSFTSQKQEQFNQLSWADELYLGETEDLKTCNAYSKETAKPSLPKLKDRLSESAFVESDKKPSSEILQVYLTTWLAEVNIDTYRIEEIFATVSEEIRVSFS